MEKWKRWKGGQPRPYRPVIQIHANFNRATLLRSDFSRPSIPQASSVVITGELIASYEFPLPPPPRFPPRIEGTSRLENTVLSTFRGINKCKYRRERGGGKRYLSLSLSLQALIFFPFSFSFDEQTFQFSPRIEIEIEKFLPGDG